MRHTLLTLAMGCTYAAGAGAQHSDAKPAPVPAYRARIIGVYDELSGEPLEGVKVMDAVGGMSALTTATGTVSLIFLPDGGSLVRLQKIGYETLTFPVSISAADTAPITKTMRHLTELPAVVTTDSAPHYISSRLRGFLERKKVEMGYFIDEATLRKNDGVTLANVLRTHAPSAQFSEGRNSAQYLMKSQRCITGGPPQVFLDGMRLAPDVVPRTGKASSNTPFDLSHFQVSDLAGVEWYPDDIAAPTEFGHNFGRCGTLLLWTRER